MASLAMTIACPLADGCCRAVCGPPPGRWRRPVLIWDSSSVGDRPGDGPPPERRRRPAWWWSAYAVTGQSGYGPPHVGGRRRSGNAPFPGCIGAHTSASVSANTMSVSALLSASLATGRLMWGQAPVWQCTISWVLTARLRWLRPASFDGVRPGNGPCPRLVAGLVTTHLLEDGSRQPLPHLL